MAYSEKVLWYFKNRPNAGELNENDPDVGTGLVGAPECGDVMQLQLQIGDDGIIKDAKWSTYGCGSAIASSALATEWLKGRTVEEAKALRNTKIVEELSLPPVKIHCSVLAEDAVKAALADYESKRPDAVAEDAAVETGAEAS